MHDRARRSAQAGLDDRRLEQLHGIARRILHEHLTAADAVDDLVAARYAGRPQPAGGLLDVGNLDGETVPAARRPRLRT